MSVTFDVFTKRNKLFYTGITITILTAAYTAWAAIYNVQFNRVIMGFMDALLVAGILTTLTFVLLAGLGGVRTYVKAGELVLTDDYILIDITKIPLNEITSIKLNLGLRTNRRGGYIVTNRITVIDNNTKTYKNRFVINSRDHDREFEKIIDQWQANGVVLNLKYHGV